MSPPLRVLWVSAWFLIAGAGAVWAQASSGTLQVPATPHHDQAVTPPSAAPRTPIQKAGPAAAKTPVVPPHGPTRPQKPGVKPSGVMPAKPAPVPPTPPTPEETKVAPAEKLPDPEKP